MESITKTADIIYDAIHKLFEMEPESAKPFVEVINSLIEHLRSRLDTVWFYPLGKMDGAVYRLKGFVGDVDTGMSSEEDLHFAFQDWSSAKRNLTNIKELPRNEPTENSTGE